MSCEVNVLNALGGFLTPLLKRRMSFYSPALYTLASELLFAASTRPVSGEQGGASYSPQVLSIPPTPTPHHQLTPICRSPRHAVPQTKLRRVRYAFPHVGKESVTLRMEKSFHLGETHANKVGRNDELR